MLKKDSVWAAAFLVIVFSGCGDGREEGGKEDTEELCRDAVDNDNDGRVDCADQDCMPYCAMVENTLELCRDRLDNDMDGRKDCEDSDCSIFCADATTDAREEDPPAETADTGEEDIFEEEETAGECGNGEVEPGEECDDGNDDDHDACTNDCEDAVCGDSILRYGYEDCDPPGSTRSCISECSSTGTQGCTSVCMWAEVCEPPEEICNGLDDDCVDGPDNGFSCVQNEPLPCITTCATVGDGLCTFECMSPAPEDCIPPDEACNGEDDDCDGICDNGYECCAGTSETCTTAEGLPGLRLCTVTCEWLPCVDDCPAECETIPSAGDIGSPCVSDSNCDHAASCWGQAEDVFNGELYVASPGGQCVLYGAGTEGCDPRVPATCPPGSRCVFLDTYAGIEYFGCLDGCEIADSSGAPFDLNCGCREGYRCDMVKKVCVDGCSNDRECCERWWDLNANGTREPEEVVLKSGCTNYCDDIPAGICQTTYACVNNGDLSGYWSGPCEGDAWCPPDGRCMDEFHYRDVATGAPRFPGGLCVKDACDLVGRGCGDYGGQCANLGLVTAPLWTCVGSCHFGRNPADADYECRTLPGQEQACYPVEPEVWLDPPTDGVDGFCWPGNFPGGSHSVGAACSADADCFSPYGVGFCRNNQYPPSPSYCSAVCNRTAAEDYSICGGDDGTGTASGVCLGDTCFESCDTPGGMLGANGCTLPGMACYMIHLFSDVYKDGASALPAGACLPACLGDAWCEEAFGMVMLCDAASGICG